MKKQYLFFIVIVLVGLNSSAQNLSCSDFQNGTFTIPNESGSQSEYKLIREGKVQMEVVEIEDEKFTIYGIIEWINECSYILKYDNSKMSLPEELQFINDHGGIVTDLIKIEDKCFYYKSVLIIDGKETQRIDGKFCKD